MTSGHCGIRAQHSSMPLSVCFRTDSAMIPAGPMIQVGTLSWLYCGHKSRHPVFGKAQARNSTMVDLPDLHSLDLFKGQLDPGSIINPGGRRTRMSGDPLRHLDCAARIHVFGDACRSEAMTTNSFQDPAGLRPFLNQLQDTPTIQASRFNRFTILAEGSL